MFLKIEKMKSQKGFTLMEMLIVIAIIAILVAIAIPVMSNQLTKSKESADLANVRAAVANYQTAAMSETVSAAAVDTKAEFLAAYAAGVTINYDSKITYVPPTKTTEGSVSYDPDKANGGTAMTFALTNTTAD